MGNKISVILSGGGLKAVSYMGFLKAMEEKGIELDVVGAISGGALISVVKGLGKDYSYIREIYKDELSFWKLFEKKILTRRSIFSQKAIEDRINKLVGDKEFKDLNIKLVIFATDLSKEKLVAFDNGKLFNPLRATIALTPILPIARFNNTEYIDGGFLSLYPTSQMRKYTEKPIIGLLTRHLDDASGIPFANKFNYFNLILKNYYKTLYELDKPDLHIVTMEKYYGHMFSFDNMDDFYEEGYRVGKNNMEKILKMLDGKNG